MDEEKIEFLEEKAEERRPGKAEFYIELALFLILGLLIGIAAKTEAVKRVSVGFDDYKMKIYQSEYNLNDMQVDQAKKRAEEMKKQEEVQPQGQAQGATTEADPVQSQSQ